MDALVYVGASTGTISAVKSAIMAILACPGADEKTKCVALKILRATCEVKNVNFTDCNFKAVPDHTEETE